MITFNNPISTEQLQSYTNQKNSVSLIFQFPEKPVPDWVYIYDHQEYMKNNIKSHLLRVEKSPNDIFPWEKQAIVLPSHREIQIVMYDYNGVVYTGMYQIPEDEIEVKITLKWDGKENAQVTIQPASKRKTCVIS